MVLGAGSGAELEVSEVGPGAALEVVMGAARSILGLDGLLEFSGVQSAMGVDGLLDKAGVLLGGLTKAFSWTSSLRTVVAGTVIALAGSSGLLESGFGSPLIGEAVFFTTCKGVASG